MAARSTLVGMSGWSYKEWRPDFYPTSKSRDWLPFYAQHFPTVELNSSFYRIPTPAMVKSWCERTPGSFLFSLKASRLITHSKRLKDCQEPLAQFEEIMDGFGHRLGPVLFQFPSSFAYQEGLLEDFLPLLRKRQRYSFEFRSQSWLNDATFKALEKHNIALCHSHMRSWLTPARQTADFLYIRLHGSTGWFKGEYSGHFLRELGKHLAAKRAYVYFNNTMAGIGALRNAQELLKLI